MQILVVDDEKNQVKSLSLGLRPHGIKVLEAYNASQALSQLNCNARVIDMVITDNAMPEMGGIELVNAIKQTYSWIPVVMMSANGNEKLMREAFHNGCESYMAKPFTIEELIHEIQRINLNNGCKYETKKEEIKRENQR